MEKPDQQPRKNHFVPQGYLRGFTEEKNVLYVLNKEYGKIRKSSPAGVAYIEDYYIIDTVDEKDSAEAENALGEIESTCLPIINKISAQEELTKSEWADLGIYLSIQYGRTPHARSRMDEVATIVTTNEMKKKLAEVVNDQKQYDELVEFLQENNPDVDVPSKDKIKEWILRPGPIADLKIDNGTYVKQFFESAWTMTEGLLRYRWKVLHAPKGSSFITSDNPIGLKTTRKMRNDQVLAILLPGVERYIPLNSKTCLFIEDEPIEPTIKHVNASKKDIKFINQLISSQAEKYVISGNRKLIESMVKRT